MLLKASDQLELLGLSPVIVVVFVICAISTAILLYRVLLNPLRDVPGPLAARFTRLWELRALRQGNFPRTHVKLHEKYGPVVRIAPNRYSIADSLAFKTVYGHGSKFTKSAFYQAFGSPDHTKADLFSERDPQRHATKRRMVASLYSMTNLLSYERFVDKCNTELCEKLRKFAAERRVIDVPKWMQYYAFDVIGEITVGKSFGLIEKETDTRGILAAIDDKMVYGSRIGLFPELHPWLALAAAVFKMKMPFIPLRDFLMEQIENRKSGKIAGNKDDFLDKLTVMRDSGKIDDLSFFTTLGANIAAGSDTTGLTLSAIIYMLLKNPTAAVKLRQEINDFERAGKISDPVTFQEAQKMPYLQAVIKEALRLHPATGQIQARDVPAGGAVLAGWFFPEGTVVGSSPWVTHLDEKTFGKEPSQFRPARWLENATETGTMDTNLFSFGAGSRTCIGKNISLLEITKLIPQIFRKFELELEHPSDEWALDAGWFVKQHFSCRVKVRSDNEAKESLETQ